MPRKYVPSGRPRGWNLKDPNKWTPRLEEHPSWKGDEARTNTKRSRARIRYALGPCEKCGEPGTDRHHKDSNTGNNDRSNIAILCRRCHMSIDGRLDALKKRLAGRPMEITPPQPCSNCSVPYKPLRRGLCAACSVYLSRTGRSRPALLQ